MPTPVTPCAVGQESGLKVTFERDLSRVRQYQKLVQGLRETRRGASTGYRLPFVVVFSERREAEQFWAYVRLHVPEATVGFLHGELYPFKRRELWQQWDAVGEDGLGQLDMLVVLATVLKDDDAQLRLLPLLSTLPLPAVAQAHVVSWHLFNPCAAIPALYDPDQSWRYQHFIEALQASAATMSHDVTFYGVGCREATFREFTKIWSLDAPVNGCDFYNELDLSDFPQIDARPFLNDALRDRAVRQYLEAHADAVILPLTRRDSQYARQQQWPLIDASQASDVEMLMSKWPGELIMISWPSSQEALLDYLALYSQVRQLTLFLTPWARHEKRAALSRVALPTVYLDELATFFAQEMMCYRCALLQAFQYTQSTIFSACPQCSSIDHIEHDGQPRAGLAQKLKQLLFKI